MADDPEDDAPEAPENTGPTGEPSRLPPGVRDAAGRFASGSTGNAGGRPGTSKEFRQLARDYSPTALKKLFQIALTGNGFAQVRACEVIIERAWGKTAIEASGPKGGPLDTRFYGAARRAIDEAIAKAVADEQARAETEGGPKN